MTSGAIKPGKVNLRQTVLDSSFLVVLVRLAPGIIALKLLDGVYGKLYWRRVDKWKKKKVWLEVPRFTGENVPVNVAARVMKKDPQFVRQGIIQGFTRSELLFKKDGSSQYDYYISPMKFWQETGYIYDGIDA